MTELVIGAKYTVCEYFLSEGFEVVSQEGTFTLKDYKVYNDLWLGTVCYTEDANITFAPEHIISYELPVLENE